jgi:hypothetical protein
MSLGNTFHAERCLVFVMAKQNIYFLKKEGE